MLGGQARWWNRYEILAVGHKIWTAINGKLCVALEDPKGELSGKISFQVHGGPAQTVLYRNRLWSTIRRSPLRNKPKSNCSPPAEKESGGSEARSRKADLHTLPLDEIDHGSGSGFPRRSMGQAGI